MRDFFPYAKLLLKLGNPSSRKHSHVPWPRWRVPAPRVPVRVSPTSPARRSIQLYGEWTTKRLNELGFVLFVCESRPLLTLPGSVYTHSESPFRNHLSQEAFLDFQAGVSASFGVYNAPYYLRDIPDHPFYEKLCQSACPAASPSPRTGQGAPGGLRSDSSVSPEPGTQAASGFVPKGRRW